MAPKKEFMWIYHLSHPAIAKTRISWPRRLSLKAGSFMSWELLRPSSRWWGDRKTKDPWSAWVSLLAKYSRSTDTWAKTGEGSDLGSRLLAALAFDHRRGIHHNIEDVLELVPQYFVVSISWYDIVTFLFPGSLQRRGLYNGSWLVCIWRTDFELMTEVKQKVFHPLTGQEVWLTPAEKGRLFTSLQKATEQEPATMPHSHAASAGMVSRLSASQAVILGSL